MLDIFEKYNKNPLVYGILENHLWVYHKEFEHAYEYNFYKERADKKLKTFVKVTDYKESVLKSNIINFVAFDEYEKIKSIAEEISKIDGINVNYYRDCLLYTSFQIFFYNQYLLKKVLKKKWK